MGIEDIQISEELETNAPSIKYSGNEGPKSPQEMEQMMMAQLEEEYAKYVDDMMEQGIEPMTLEQFLDQAMAEGQMSKGPILPSPEDPVNPFQPKPQGPVLPDRQMAAYGGIMGLDGRRQYGLGSKFKKFVRKIIPNEVADIAVKAAPFVAPFNPIAAGLMSGIGGFDQTGKIGSSIKSGLMNYGLGQGARYLGGADLQGMSLKMPSGNYFSKPTGTNKRFFDDIFKSKTTPGNTEVKGSSVYDNVEDYDQLTDMVVKDVNKTGTGGIMETIKGLIPESTLGKVALSGGALALGTALLGKPGETISAIMDRGEGLDVEAIRAEVLDAYNDETGEKLLALQTKYPYLGRADTKDFAMGGRAGYAGGGGPTADMVLENPSKVSQSQQQQIKGNKMAEAALNDILYRFYEKFPGVDASSMSIEDIIAELQAEKVFEQENLGVLGLDRSMDMITPESARNSARRIMMGDTQYGEIPGMMYGGRIRRAEGGLMDLGGMEKDYRAEGGFVPIGKAEKADDVPARLSVNEFVFTADAVRNAGGGDIDKGAEVMENMMKNLEQGGQVSEESQGMQGARDMFETSQRLSEVVG